MVVENRYDVINGVEAYDGQISVNINGNDPLINDNLRVVISSMSVELQG